MLKKIQKILTDRKTRFAFLTRLGLYNVLSDEEYLKRRFKLYLGYSLNLDNPRTFNEKIQWLKIHDRKPEYTMMVDKYAVKKYVAKKIGRQYIIPTLGVWDRFDDIDFEDLPDRFVLKCTHDSGSVIICHNKSKFNKKSARRMIDKCMKRNYYWVGREWPYKHVKHRILIEPYMEDHKAKELNDYKFFCFNGVVDCVMVCMERKTGSPKFYFFDKNWNLRRWNVMGKNAPKGFTLPKPFNMDQMVTIAEKLSEGLLYVRVDLYSINEKIYFGEMTFYPQSGFDSNLLSEADLAWGKMLNLSNLNKYQKRCREWLSEQ